MICPATDQMKENSLTPKKKTRSRQYPAETITDKDYADDLALLSNTNVSSEKTEFMRFKQDSAFSTLKDKPLKLVVRSK